MSSLAQDTQWVDAIDQAELVRSGKVSPIELLDAAIERAEQLNPAINALTFTWFDTAREIARNLPTNSAMPLRGVPFILKDLHAAMKGHPLSNGNKAMKAAALNSTYTAEIVQRFINAGLVIFGRGNSPEFGSVPTTEPEAWGPTRNPWDTNRMAGGSSGGSAAAVASGIVPAAHATDGGGSVRIPAACCGLVGLKVSQGRITAAPLRDETNLGVEHVVSRTVRDTALLLDIAEGPGIGDRVIAPPPTRPYLQEIGAPTGKLKIGFLDHRPVPGDIDPECAEGVRLVAKVLEQLGHHVDAAWPHALEDQSFAPKFTSLWSTNMSVAREGVAVLLGREVTKDDFELVNWTMAEYSKRASATDYANAILSTSHYRRAVQQWWADGWDILLTPTAARVPLPIGSFDNDPNDPMKPMKVAADFVPFTPAFNTSGQPAISLPLHWTADGVPVGMQLVAGYGREDLLIRLASQLEVAMPWAHRRPVASQLK
jgi:amidase